MIRAFPTSNAAELAEQVGVGVDRIVLLDDPRPPTKDDVLRLADGEPKRLCELVDGVLVEKAMGYLEGLLAVKLVRWIDTYVEEQGLGGWTNASDGLIDAFGANIRIPDVSYVTEERIIQHRGNFRFLRVGPDLTVEVLSPSNTRAEMIRKRQNYFSAGVRLHWEIDPDTRSVTVYRSLDESQVLSGDDVLTGEDVLPGFLLPLPKLFAILDDYDRLVSRNST